MAGGIFNSILNPAALITGAVEVPLLAWARQAEITADRAGLLTVGDEEVARRVLLSWSLKSAFIFRQINIEAWLEQQAADDEGYSKLSQLTTSPTLAVLFRVSLEASRAPVARLVDSIGIIFRQSRGDSEKPEQTQLIATADCLRCAG